MFDNMPVGPAFPAEDLPGVVAGAPIRTVKKTQGVANQEDIRPERLPRRGEVYWARCRFVGDNEGGSKARPVVIISADQYCSNPKNRTYVALEISKSEAARNHLYLGCVQEISLRGGKSVCKAASPVQLTRDDLGEYIETLSPRDMDAVDQAVADAYGLTAGPSAKERWEIEREAYKAVIADLLAEQQRARR